MKSSRHQGRTARSQKKTAGYEHTLPILFADPRSGLQTDMLQLFYLHTYPAIVKENHAAPHGGNTAVSRASHLSLEAMGGLLPGFLALPQYPSEGGAQVVSRINLPPL